MNVDIGDTVRITTSFSRSLYSVPVGLLAKVIRSTPVPVYSHEWAGLEFSNGLRIEVTRADLEAFTEVVSPLELLAECSE